MNIKRSDSEIYEVLDTCADSDTEGSNFPGMSYEDGIKYAIEWMTDGDAPELFDE